MKRSFLALLLLSTFLFGWVAGPHPCHETPAGQQMSGHASCHEQAPAAAQGKSSMRAPSCCDVACPHACHMVAVLSIEPVTLPVAPLARTPAEKASRNVPPVAFGIDHIPLA